MHITMRMDYSLTLHNCNLAVITTAGLMTFVDHLENLAALKTYICQRITTLGKAPCLNYVSRCLPMDSYVQLGDLYLSCIVH